MYMSWLSFQGMEDMVHYDRVMYIYGHTAKSFSTDHHMMEGLTHIWWVDPFWQYHKDTKEVL